jgi:hypothetical protein
MKLSLLLLAVLMCSSFGTVGAADVDEDEDFDALLGELGAMTEEGGAEDGGGGDEEEDDEEEKPKKKKKEKDEDEDENASQKKVKVKSSRNLV